MLSAVLLFKATLKKGPWQAWIFSQNAYTMLTPFVVLVLLQAINITKSNFIWLAPFIQIY